MMGTAQAEIDALCKEYPDFAEDFRREGPQHKVTIAKPFAVGRFPVTRGEFAAFVKETGHSVPDEAYTHEGGKWEMQGPLISKSRLRPGRQPSCRVRELG